MSGLILAAVIMLLDPTTGEKKIKFGARDGYGFTAELFSNARIKEGASVDRKFILLTGGDDGNSAPGNNHQAIWRTVRAVGFKGDLSCGAPGRTLRHLRVRPGQPAQPDKRYRFHLNRSAD